jgi:hypothetical protein
MDVRLFCGETELEAVVKFEVQDLELAEFFKLYNIEAFAPTSSISAFTYNMPPVTAIPGGHGPSTFDKSTLPHIERCGRNTISFVPGR